MKKKNAAFTANSTKPINTSNVYILSIEAKDAFNANHLHISPTKDGTDTPIGYNIRNKDGEIRIKRFINSLDYSLELLKLREVYYSIYRNAQFSFIQKEKEYSQQIINVTFSYALKEFNKSAGHTFIRNGYLPSHLEFKDHICIKDGQLLGIEVDAELENPVTDETILGKYFTVEDGKYKQKSVIPNVMNKAELRTDLYENGFWCDGIHYIRYKRSSGSSRVGKCLFINERLYKSMHRWERCGLEVKSGDKIDLAAWEAYISLPLSSIIDTIEIDPTGILVIDDYESVFQDTVVAVDYNGEELEAKETEATIKNSIFDGESLLDASYFEKYAGHSMLLLRNQFFKSACFNTNIQQWFEDNGITEVSQLKGFTLATDIKQIKMITTASSIKYVKFGTLRKWMKTISPVFGVVKYDKPTHYFQGRMVQCHYQLLNTLQLSEAEIDELLEPNLDYIRQIRTNPAVLRYHLKQSQTTKYSEFGAKNIDEVVFLLLGMNPDFAYTELYDKFNRTLTNSMIRNLKRGHLLIDGNYSTLLGNGLEMLQASIGTFKGESLLGTGKIYSKRFVDGEVILGSRSPHINSGNILLVTNVRDKQIEKYFNLSNEIVYVNSIGENIQQRLNG